MANSKDITKFLKDVSVIRELDIRNPSAMLSPNLKERLDELIKGEVTELSHEYADLESPEKEYLESIKNFYGLGDKKNKYDYSEIEKGKLSLDTPLSELYHDSEITTRAYRCLMDDIDYLGELVQTQKDDIFKRRNFGKKSMESVEKLVSNAGYTFGMNINYVRPENRK